MENEELAEYGLAAIHEAELSITNIVPTDSIVKKGSEGDIVTAWDSAVHESVSRFFAKRGINICFLGEEGSYINNNPELVILMDEIEGTQNAINALPYGTNIAISKFKNILSFDDIAVAIVTNLRDGRKFVAIKNGETTIFDKGNTRKSLKKSTEIWEVPLGYMKTEDQRERQQQVFNLFYSLFGPQCRSLDSTGTRLAEIVDRNVLVYADWRDVTKPWDVIPSAFILNQANLPCTDILGFPFTGAILARDGKLNMELGKNFLAGEKESYDRALTGAIKLYLTKSSVSDLLNGGSLLGEIKLPSELYRTQNLIARLTINPLDYGYIFLTQLADADPSTMGRYMAKKFNDTIADKKKAYGIIKETSTISFKQAVESYLEHLPSSKKIISTFENNIGQPF